jgi:histidinol-phosphate aminotransferase
MRASSESFPVNILAQIAGEAALEDVEFMQKTVEVNRIGREYLTCEFARLGLKYPPSHTNFLLLHVGPQAGQVYQKLLERGVIVRPCTGYDLPEHLRITIGTPEQNERLVNELEKILGARESVPVMTGSR